ncbi:MAG TPA: ABC transporter ATP-binding protein [Actinomycetota bacterium]|nr:ABC transporter ATP-binding protein [Actinomycetota bacterium]
MADGQTEPVLRLEGVSRRFGGLVAVDGISLTLGPRRRLAVIGPNGAGKTTLFRLIAGDVPPSQGRVFLFGREVTRLPAHRRARLGLSRTFQVSNLFAGLSVLDNVRLAAQAGQPGRWRRLGPVRPGDRVGLAAMEALERAGIAARAGDRVAELSHGEQRQLEVALALATSPKLLLLDEPAAGLSAGERSRLRELLGSLPDSLPLLLIEHDMTLALSLADEVLCLHNGRPIALGPPDRVRGDPTVQAVYLGRTVDA